MVARVEQAVQVVFFFLSRTVLETCSQGSDLGQEKLNEIEQKAQAKSTKKATEWGLRKFDKWCEKRAIKVD